MIKSFWSIARFDYTILGIIATFSASANESSPLSLRTEIPNKNTALNSPESHPTVPPPPQCFWFSDKFCRCFFDKKIGNFFFSQLNLFFVVVFSTKELRKLGNVLHLKKNKNVKSTNFLKFWEYFINFLISQN
jgi:hypothetical protein